MTTPNAGDLVLPVTYTGSFEGPTGTATFKIDGQSVSNVSVPFTGQVLVQIASGSRAPVYGYANGGGYKYNSIALSTGAAYGWRCAYAVVVNKGQSVTAYPYIGTGDSDPRNVGAPVSITFFPMGEHKN